MAAYYNEIDPVAAQWLRNLIAAGLIAPGDVDERSIEDVSPSDLQGYTQCHFFAGVGVWSYALRQAGWPDDRSVWTGSCPCQPFSTAGKGTGFADERHLWPAFHYLINECRPAVVFGEQVASKDADSWIDLVQADMEALAYAFGALPFPAAGVGAPHIRDRLYWLGYAGSEGLEGHTGDGRPTGWQRADRSAPPTGIPLRLGNAAGQRFAKAGPVESGSAQRPADAGAVLGGVADAPSERQHGGRAGEACYGALPTRVEPQRLRAAGHVADSHGVTCGQGSADGNRRNTGSDALARPGSGCNLLSDGRQPGPVNGFWEAADWLACRDGRWRPVEPGTSPLAHGASARVGRLRAYGNAINAKAAEEMIRAFIESVPALPGELARMR